MLDYEFCGGSIRETKEKIIQEENTGSDVFYDANFDEYGKRKNKQYTNGDISYTAVFRNLIDVIEAGENKRIVYITKDADGNYSIFYINGVEYNEIYYLTGTETRQGLIDAMYSKEITRAFVIDHVSEKNMYGFLKAFIVYFGIHSLSCSDGSIYAGTSSKEKISIMLNTNILRRNITSNYFKVINARASKKYEDARAKVGFESIYQDFVKDENPGLTLSYIN